MAVSSTISALADASKYDRCLCKEKSAKYPFIYEAKTPRGKCALLKTLVSNHCKGDCKYCVNNVNRHTPRDRMDERDLAYFFMKLRREGLVQGAFLSSGIDRDADYSMQRIVRTAEVIRNSGFRGYIHLKIIPGASRDMIRRTVELADRVSINLETPSGSFLSDLSSQKNFKTDIIRRLRWASKMVKGTHKDITTQFIVGATKESDMEIMRTCDRLYQRFRIKRAFFSAFNPIKGTPMEKSEAESATREFRLYQTDFLLRDYGFGFKDLVFEEDNNLNLKMDPKYRIAVANRDSFPINPQTASYDELLKVPGIGPTSANRLMRYRREGKVSKKMLSNSGAATKRALPFLKIGNSFQQHLGAFSKA
jgi:predicted DNA-binding helix-hairpin-helix protein